MKATKWRKAIINQMCVNGKAAMALLLAVIALYKLYLTIYKTEEVGDLQTEEA